MPKQTLIKFFSTLIIAFFLNFILAHSVNAATSCCLYYKGSGAQSQCTFFDKTTGAPVKLDLTDDSGKIVAIADFSCKDYDQTTQTIIKNGKLLLLKNAENINSIPLNYGGNYQAEDATKCIPIKGYSFKFEKAPPLNDMCNYEWKEPAFDSLLQNELIKIKQKEEAQKLKEQENASTTLKEVELAVNQMCCFPKSHKYLLSTGNNFSDFIFKPSIKQKIVLPFGMTANSPDACKTSTDDKTNEIVAKLVPLLTCDQLPDGTISTEQFWVATQNCTSLATLAPWKLDVLTPSEMAAADIELHNFCILGPQEYKSKKGTAGIDFEIPETSGLNKLGSTDVNIIIGRVIKAIMGIMGSIALAMFVYSGILWMTAAGNSEKEEKSKTVLVWSTLGVIVVFASYALLNFVFEIVK